jgi:hypothetical protein
MNAANSSKGHDRAAASRRLGNDGRRARGDRMRHSQQQLRARIRRTIRAQWNLNFAWRRPVPRASQPSATRECGRVLRLLALPLSQRPFVPMRSRFRVGLARVACSCRRCNAGNVRKLTCQKPVPARGCARISTRRPRSPAGDCRHIGVQLQGLPRGPNQPPTNSNGPQSPLRKKLF